MHYGLNVKLKSGVGIRKIIFFKNDKSQILNMKKKILKNNKKDNLSKGKIVIYRAKDGSAELEAILEKETIWLRQEQIAVLFGTQRPAITKHLRNIFKSGELDKNSVSSVLEHTATDGKKYKTQFYNLDAIISIGYRVNSIGKNCRLGLQFKACAWNHPFPKNDK